MDLMTFLITIAFDLYLTVVILRIWLQVVRADFYNPLSQFVVKVTNPLVLPLRRLFPMAGNWDIATIVLALIISIAKSMVLIAIAGIGILWFESIVVGSFNVVHQFLELLFWVVIIRALLSWFSQGPGRNPMEVLLIQLTEPVLSPIRRIIPPIGGLDLSVLVAIIGIQALQILLGMLRRAILGF